ncbi:MAG TPA: ImmA/IrrE family metallo-endopeptidase [Bacteroidales bacterium]|jgi:addiction module HigA family antidote|nr:ImmA/IrrE family metallo-endopeptidase [Bacteroidales bacterium]HOS70993.1 ImmA/IrrE family metallo-endopeptidase [Bacteroidales bacterium]HQH25473.1 ImmA/IrrE family metallo-endopeptidase [Bacteroidales bacterium]HQK70179.1 ImmA/IrrE family metallo-endopeptidase [Bacteroidales bacterium]
MRPDIHLQKELLSPPGDTIQETIDALGMSQAELAERIGRSKEKLNGLINGSEPLTLKTAILLERVLDIPAAFWLEREKEYRLDLAKIEEQEFLTGCIEWTEKFPVKELKKDTWLPDTKDKAAISGALLKFFSVASPEQWNNIYLNESVTASFKISLANTQSPHSISAWLRIGELKTKQLKLPEYNKKAFSGALNEIKKIVFDHPHDSLIQLQEKCFRCGVAVLYTACLPKAPVSGAVWWRGNNPIIQLSGRYKTNDSFWFAFYHEAGHILKHGKKEIFLEDVNGSPMDEEKESEADEFAQKKLFPEAAFETLKKIIDLKVSDIIEFADKYETHPAIIVGQLQHFNIISHSSFNHLKVPVNIPQDNLLRNKTNE